MLNSLKLEKLKTIFLAYPDIEAVYLFGSVAMNKATRKSDIDLGIVTSSSPTEGYKINLYTDMIRKGLDNTDITFFKSANLILQFEIIHNNKLIYQKPGFNHGELFSKVVRKYLDFKPFLNRQRKYYKKRILND